MYTPNSRPLALATATATAAVALAVSPLARAGDGPDISVSQVGLASSGSSDAFGYFGTADGIRAFAMGATACNLGGAAADFFNGSAGNHPVMGQNVFRLLDGRFEHIGQSWLKHEFCAVNEGTCGACQPTSCSTLGAGCATTSWPEINDGQDGGPKSAIDPQGIGPGGTHDNHGWAPPTGPFQIAGRLQIRDEDILAGGRFYAELQFVTHDETPANRHDNAAWREIDLTLTSMSGTEPGPESVHVGEPAIMAWPAHDPNATVVVVDVPDEGRFLVGASVTENGDGTWHYEYAVQNLNSDRAAGGFGVPVPAGTTVTAVGFHDVAYHSGEPFDGTDWVPVLEGGQLTWSTVPWAIDEDANALRWGTLYNFRFDADAPPATAVGRLGLFEPGTPSSLTFDVPGPAPMGEPCPADTDGSGDVAVPDLVNVITLWGSDGHGPGVQADIDGDGTVDVSDLVGVITAWGPC